MRRLSLCMTVVLFAIPAAAQDVQPPAVAYRAVMAAQRAAKTPAQPMPAEEARRIQEKYQQSASPKPADRPSQSGGGAGVQPR